MPRIAFISHSFSKRDDELVSEFLAFLQTVKESIPEFDFVTANRSEPIDIANKIIPLLDASDLLIALCTKSEVVCDINKFKNNWLLRIGTIFNSRSFEYKTTDWMIQEIGFALGKKIPIIILKENNVRKPGEFQGNIEYIEFGRNKISDSFNKLLQMISSKTVGIVVKNRSITSEPPTFSPDNPDAEVEAHLAEALSVAPMLDSYEAFVGNLRNAIVNNDFVGADKIFEEFKISKYAQDPRLRVAYEAYKYFLEARKDITAIKKLQELLNQHPTFDKISFYLAMIHSSNYEYSQAAELFIRSAQNSENSRFKISYYGYAFNAQIKAKKYDKAENLLKIILAITKGDSDQYLSYLKFLSIFYKETRNFTHYHAILEKYLQSSPYDIEKRFDLAFSYSEHGLHKLSLYHYNRLSQLNSSGAVFNNLGVAANSLGMSSISVKYYKNAIDFNDETARSNLANQLSSQGFLDEALEYCKSIMQNGEISKDIQNSLKIIEEKKNNDAKSFDDVLEKAENEKEIILLLSESILSDPITDREENWKFQQYTLHIKIRQLVFSAEGDYESFYWGGLQSLNSFTNRKFHVIYEGTVIGSAISFSAKIIAIDTTPTKIQKEFNGVIFITPQGKVFTVDYSEAGLIKNEITILS